MIRKKSEAAILGLLDSFSQAGLAPIGEETEFDNENENTSEIESIPTAPKRLIKQTEQLINISPERCKPWAYADRILAEMGNIEDLATSIQKNGQQEPILVRNIPIDENGVEFEIIFGNRRWRACSLIGKPLKAIIRNVTDQEAAVCQQEENNNRVDLSDFSKSVSYTKLLHDKIFHNLSELSAKMNIPKTTLSNIMSYSRINPRILKAMPNPSKLNRASAAKLAALSTNIDEIQLLKIIELAPLINSGNIAASKIQSKIIENKEDSTLNSYNKTVDSNSGIPIFTIKKEGLKSLTISLSKNIINLVPIDFLEKNIKNCIEKILYEHYSQTVRSTEHKKSKQSKTKESLNA